MFDMGLESGYILCKSDGTLELYYGDKFLYTLTNESLDIEPFSKMLIIYEGSEN